MKEKDELAHRLTEGLTAQQKTELDALHKDEINKLKSKLRWYAENQELLDKSTARLRAKDEEIHRLKMRLEDFKSGRNIYFFLEMR